MSKRVVWISKVHMSDSEYEVEDTPEDNKILKQAQKMMMQAQTIVIERGKLLQRLDAQLKEKV